MNQRDFLEAVSIQYNFFAELGPNINHDLAKSILEDIMELRACAMCNGLDADIKRIVVDGKYFKEFKLENSLHLSDLLIKHVPWVTDEFNPSRSSLEISELSDYYQRIVKSRIKRISDADSVERVLDIISSLYLKTHDLLAVKITHEVAKYFLEEKEKGNAFAGLIDLKSVGRSVGDLFKTYIDILSRVESVVDKNENLEIMSFFGYFCKTVNGLHLPVPATYIINAMDKNPDAIEIGEMAPYVNLTAGTQESAYRVIKALRLHELPSFWSSLDGNYSFDADVTSAAMVIYIETPELARFDIIPRGIFGVSDDSIQSFKNAIDPKKVRENIPGFTKLCQGLKKVFDKDRTSAIPIEVFRSVGVDESIILKAMGSRYVLSQDMEI